MGPQIIEILIFAGVAFFIINKLISLLGTFDEESAKFQNSKFGEPSGAKDVTSSGTDWKNPINIGGFVKAYKSDYSVLIDPQDKTLQDSLDEMPSKIENFDQEKFIQNAQKAIDMIIGSLKDDDNIMLKELVDRRFVNNLKNNKEYYQSVDTSKISDLKISDITFFGNSIIIKLIVNIDRNESEEWAFSRNVNQDSPNWYLSNIEKFDQ